MGTINNSFDKLYQYIQSRKDIDNKHSGDIEDLKDKVDFICWYLEDNHVNFRIREVEDKKFGKGFEFTVLENVRGE